MWNNMLIEFMRMYISPSQHGYIPGRGTKTAWQEIIKKMDKYDYIYETDLKNFFNEISVPAIFKIIKETGIPLGIYYHLENFTKNTPKLQKVDQVDESTFRDKEDIYNNPDFTNNKTVQKILEPFKENPELLYQFMREDGCESVSEWLQLQWALFSEYDITDFGDFTKGVPQGMPLSPLLSIIPLARHYLNQCEHVNYADDQLFFSNKPIEIKDNKELGIIHAEEKCKYVKYAGKWTKDGLKFLGLRLLNGIDLRSETRSETREKVKEQLKKIFDEKTLNKIMQLEDEKDFTKILSEVNIWSGSDRTWLKNLAKRNIFGFVLACLQNADWENNSQRDYYVNALVKLLGEVNQNSWLAALPTKTSSSAGLFFLHSVVVITKKKRVNAKQITKLC